MGTVILDDDLKVRLNGLNQHLEIRDADGHLVGHILPDATYRAVLDATRMAQESLPHLTANCDSVIVVDDTDKP